MKRVRPNLLYRLKNAAVPAAKTLLGSMGVVGTPLGIASAFGIVFPLNLLYVAGAICLAPPVFVFVRRSRSIHLPDVIVDVRDSDEQYTAVYCSSTDLREANSWTKPHYKDEYVSDEVADSWRARSPQAFVALKNVEGTLCAAFGIIAIEPGFMKQFVKGKVRDNRLGADDLLDDSKRRSASQLYISGVVVRDPDTSDGHKRACAMIWAMVKYIEHHFGTRKKRTLYALAVNKQSRNLLIKAGFAHENGPGDREDKYELFAIQATKQSLAAVQNRIGDYSQQCRLRFLES